MNIRKISLLAALLIICSPASLASLNATNKQPITPSQNNEAITSNSLLKGSVTTSPSPLLQGSIQVIPEGTKFTLTMQGNINSEISQKGDEVVARVSVDIKDGDRVLLPGGWYMHGLVTEIAPQRNLGRDGYVKIEFDKLTSPDGNYELPFKAELSTHDSTGKAIAKQVIKDGGHITVGAIGGSILSIQLTGIPVAISTEGYSVAIGAGAGALIGAIGALKRRGKITSIYPGDEMTVTVSEPLELPGFDPRFLPSAIKVPKLDNLDLSIEDTHFKKDPYDNRSRLLTIDLTIKNHTKREFSFLDLAVISDHNQRYYPSVLDGLIQRNRKVSPGTSESGTVTFSVDSPKRTYWLVLLDKHTKEELTRVPVN